ncbi:MAG: B3/4 domain-containing protein [Anaerolineales bacterium]|jgi:DNA/RNA-binding domain of Phe-tRNA-synthetase-like protein
MLAFQYHPEIFKRYPNITGGVILAHQINNGPTPETLKEIYFAEQQAVINNIGSKPLSELVPLAAWRAAFRDFGVNPTKYRSAVEALLRRLTKKGDIPSINAVVDICNLISIRYQVPVAAFDARALNGPITVQFASGDENFTPLFEKVPEHPEAGEVIFADNAQLVVARRWCWRQSDESATRPDTADAVFTIEAQHPNNQEYIRAALADLLELLQTHVGGSFMTGVAGTQNPTVTE